MSLSSPLAVVVPPQRCCRLSSLSLSLSWLSLVCWAPQSVVGRPGGFRRLCRASLGSSLSSSPSPLVFWPRSWFILVVTAAAAAPIVVGVCCYSCRLWCRSVVPLVLGLPGVVWSRLGALGLLWRWWRWSCCCCHLRRYGGSRGGGGGSLALALPSPGCSLMLLLLPLSVVLLSSLAVIFVILVASFPCFLVLSRRPRCP